LLVETGVEATTVKESNMVFNIKVAKPPVFNGKVSKIAEFIITYKLYLKNKIKGVLVKKQIQ